MARVRCVNEILNETLDRVPTKGLHSYFETMRWVYVVHDVTLCLLCHDRADGAKRWRTGEPSSSNK